MNYHLAVLIGLIIFALNLVFNLRALRNRKNDSVALDPVPFVSVLIPARDEEANIEPCLNSLRQQEYQNFEILILDDNSSDGTATIVRRLASLDERICLVAGQPLREGWAGKPFACYQLAQKAKGDYLLFVDADTVHAPNMLRNVMSLAVGSGCSLISGFPRQIATSLSERVTIPLIYFIILSWLPLWWLQSSRKLKPSLAIGQFLLFPRDEYWRIGGHEAVKSKIGYMAQQFSLYGELSVYENLIFFADLFDVPPRSLQERVSRLLDFAGLSEFKDRRASHLSGGMQKKLALACTLIHQPQILLLDEPTTGVDPISRREFWDILTELFSKGTTILVSTPYMDEADRCSRVGLMYAGKMAICNTPQNIKAQINGELIQIMPNEWRTAYTLLKDLPGVYEIQTYGEALHLLVDSAEKRLPEIESVLQDNQLDYRGARTRQAGMEEAFISLIKGMES